MKIFLLIVLTVFTNLCYSLENENPNKISEAIAVTLKTQNPNKGLEVLHEAKNHLLELADSTKAKYFLGLATAHGQLGNSDSSLYYLDKCGKIASRINSDYLLLKTYNVKGLVYMGLGEYENSLDYYQRALKIGNKYSSEKHLVAVQQTLGNIGGIFYKLKDFKSSIEYTQRSLDISNQLNETAGIAYNKLRLAIIYKDTDSLASSIRELKGARHLLKVLGDTVTLLYAENTLGGIYEHTAKYDSAKLHYQYAVDLANTLEVTEELIYTQISLANVYLILDDLKIAERIAKKAKREATEKNYPNSVKNTIDILYKIQLQQKKYKSALQLRNQFISLSDSISSADVRMEIANLQTKYETTKKESEIKKLTLENQLKDANLAKSRNAQYAIVIGSSLTILLLIVFFILRQKKVIAERKAQELQVEALKKRFMELHSSPAELAVEMDFSDMNEKLHTPLTEREFETLKLSIEGKTNIEIGTCLLISVNTVKFHLRNTYSKIGVGNRKEAFQFMLKSS